MSANDPGQPPQATPSHDRTHSEWSRNRDAPRVALAIGAHPDDIEFGAGGTLAKWAARGTEIHHLVLTDGSKGTWNPAADIAALVAQRDAEQRAAATALGARGTVTMLGHVDGDLEHSRALVEEVCLHVRRVAPDVVLTHDPWKRYRLHPDHRHTGFIVCDAIVAARDPHFFPHHSAMHGVTHHRPDALLLWEADEPNHVEDVSFFVDTKLRALEQHVSQFESTMKVVQDAELEVFRSRMRSRLAELGEPHGCAAAEVFHLMTRL